MCHLNRHLWCMFFLRVCLEKGERAEFLDDDGSLLAMGLGMGRAIC